MEDCQTDQEMSKYTFCKFTQQLNMHSCTYIVSPVQHNVGSPLRVYFRKPSENNGIYIYSVFIMVLIGHANLINYGQCLHNLAKVIGR